MKPNIRQFALISILYFAEKMASRDLRKTLLAKIRLPWWRGYSYFRFYDEMSQLEEAGLVISGNEQTNIPERQGFRERYYQLTQQGRQVLYTKGI